MPLKTGTANKMKINIILGDQLDSDSSLFKKYDKSSDVIFMAAAKVQQ